MNSMTKIGTEGLKKKDSILDKIKRNPIKTGLGIAGLATIGYVAAKPEFRVAFMDAHNEALKSRMQGHAARMKESLDKSYADIKLKHGVK